MNRKSTLSLLWANGMEGALNNDWADVGHPVHAFLPLPVLSLFYGPKSTTHTSSNSAAPPCTAKG
jgi:hypothetical protein